MEPLQILGIVLGIVGVWAIVEIAVTARRARASMNVLDRSMGSIDKAVDEMSETIAEVRPVVAKLDGALDDLQPAIARVEPLMESANTAVEALSANLVEIEGVVRDVSVVSGAAASAGNAVSGVADSASKAARRILGKIKVGSDERTLEGMSVVSESLPEEALGSEAAFEQAQDTGAHLPSRYYYTYEAATDETADASQAPSTEQGEM